MNQQVLIITGPYKGQRGKAVHMNGDRATVETSMRAKTPQIHLHRTDLKLLNDNKDEGKFIPGQSNRPEEYPQAQDTMGG